MDAYEKLFAKTEFKRKQAENRETEEMLTAITEDEKKTKGTIENENKLTVKVEPEKEPQLFKPKSLIKLYLMGFGILAITIIAGVVIALSNRTQSVKGDLEPVYRSTALVYTGNGFPAIQNIFKITRNAFGSEIEFQNHQKEAINVFNNAAKHHNPDYQAATANLSIEG
ncbi:MAG: hypothetical protein ACYSTS_08710, partial [Planctomycetota bacterium]